ncbi:MAG: hypothetical protein RR623_08180 [Bacilli bacterium]
MSAIKSRDFVRNTMSEMFGKLQFRSCTAKERYNEKGSYDYIVKVLQDETDEIFDVTVANEPLDVKKGEVVDLMNFVYRVRAKGTGAFNGNVQCELAETYMAEKLVKANHVQNNQK